MTERACKSCGAAEQRKLDAKGRELVNLDPVSGLCVNCLSKSIGPKPMDPEPFDAKLAQAGRDE